MNFLMPFLGITGKVYKIADVNAVGLTLTDILKNDWEVGKVVGVGGFGRLYEVIANNPVAVHITWTRYFVIIIF